MLPVLKAPSMETGEGERGERDKEKRKAQSLKTSADYMMF